MKNIQRTNLINGLILTLVTAVALLSLVVVATVSIPATSYADGQTQVCEAIGGCTGGGTELSKVIKTVINIMSAIGGVIAVIMIIIGGIRFVTSSGDSNSTASARNTIIYALIGLVVIAFAQVIVQFVLERT